jgi:hypothetical protein
MSKKVYIPTWLEILKLICKDKGLSLDDLLNEVEQVELRNHDGKVNILVNPPAQYIEDE